MENSINSNNKLCFNERQLCGKTEKTGKEQPDQKPKTKKHDMEL